MMANYIQHAAFVVPLESAEFEVLVYRTFGNGYITNHEAEFEQRDCFS